MKRTIVLVISILIIINISCKKESPNDIPSQATLLFKSGFEDGVFLDPPNEDTPIGNFQLIKGTDTETGFSWPINILGANTGGLHFIDDDNFQALENEIQSVIGHNGDTTNALYNAEHYDIGITQCPYEILDIADGTKDLYVKYWMKIDSASSMQKDKWRAIFEYKTKSYAIGLGFRLIAFIYTDEDGIPYWHWQGDKNPTHAIWEIDNRNIPVPLNKWFLTEFYWHWSEGDDGRALWKINGQIVGDHYGPTTRHSKPIDFIMLTQIYGDANPKYQWIDDIEIWDSLPE
ncbi:MAG: hypothetical protein J7K64_05910 [Bacteroidales bacterium]|nr:hypothetical protein [Bacteroidales bacterium]